MTPTVISWTIAAVLLFWAVGAYNRLMRLRAEAKSAFDVLDAEIARQVELVRGELPPPDATQPAPLEGEPTSVWSALHAAATQFSTTLSAARAKPLEPENIAALSAAQDVLALAWERMVFDAQRHLVIECYMIPRECDAERRGRVFPRGAWEQGR